MKKIKLSQIMKYIFMIAICLIIIIPLLVVFLGAFKTHTEFYQSDPLSLPKSFLNFQIHKAH